MTQIDTSAPPRSKHHPGPRTRLNRSRVSAVERQRQAMELRMAGHSFPVIARELGYKGHSSAIAAVKAGMQKTLAEPAAELRKVTYSQLTRILQVWWPRMLAGDAVATRICFEGLTDIRELCGLDLKVEPDVNVNIDQRRVTLNVTYDD